MVTFTSSYFQGAIWQICCRVDGQKVWFSKPIGFRINFNWPCENACASRRKKNDFNIMIGTLVLSFYQIEQHQMHAFRTNAIPWNKWHIFMFWANIVPNFRKWQFLVSVHLFLLSPTKTRFAVSNQLKL